MFRRTATFILLLAACAATASAENPPREKTAYVLLGRLEHQGEQPVIRTRDNRVVRVTATDSWPAAILSEKRASGKQLQLQGRWKGPDTFEADRLFSIHNGKLHKVVYFCDVCNITSYKPGRCDCCQEPTELREFPHDPHRP